PKLEGREALGKSGCHRHRRRHFSAEYGEPADRQCLALVHAQSIHPKRNGARRLPSGHSRHRHPSRGRACPPGCRIVEAGGHAPQRLKDRMCIERSTVHTMRTNIVIDDKLMRDTLRATGVKTKREAVELGLRTLLRLRKQAKIRRLRGKLRW